MRGAVRVKVAIIFVERPKLDSTWEMVSFHACSLAASHGGVNLPTETTFQFRSSLTFPAMNVEVELGLGMICYVTSPVNIWGHKANDALCLVPTLNQAGGEHEAVKVSLASPVLVKRTQLQIVRQFPP